jgi:LmbE family N-acetylglucosaminyl deacetylase
MVAMNIRELGTILFVGAHPDDEIFIAGGILAQAVRNGQRVACVTATHGEQGVQDTRLTPGELAQVRIRELEKSLAILGVKEHSWLSYSDGRCAEADKAEAADKVRRVVEKVRPDTILTFGPDGLTGHPDHQAVSGWVSQAAGSGTRVLWAVVAPEQYEQLRPADEAANIFYNIERPPLAEPADCAVDFRLPPDVTELKSRAFEVVASQMEKILAARPFDKPGEALARECFVMATGGNNGRGSEE